MNVADILEVKGKGVDTINIRATVWSALSEMISAAVGSLVVVDERFEPVGIITERDIIRLVYTKERDAWRGLAVQEVMTRKIIVGVPNDDVDYIMALMTMNRIRHVPIVEQGRLAGIVSIGDIVKSQLKDARAENHYLSEYIAGAYPA